LEILNLKKRKRKRKSSFLPKGKKVKAKRKKSEKKLLLHLHLQKNDRSKTIHVSKKIISFFEKKRNNFYLKEFNRIISGELDNLPEAAFYLVGNMNDVLAKAETLQG